MRILHILNEIQKVGNGIANVTIDLACLQAKVGHDVAVVSAGGGYEVLLQKFGVQHFLLDQQRTPVNLIKASLAYPVIIEKFNPDIVHAHMMTGMVLARLLKGQKSYALVSTVHNEFQRSAILMGWADRVIAVSQAVAKSMQQRGVPEKKLHVVCNGTLGSPRNRLLSEYQPLPLQHPAIVTVAGMYKRKGIAELIDAFCKIASAFPSAHLYLIGDGPDKSLFNAQVCNSDVSSRVHFEGFQPEPQKYLLSADIFVLASHREPFGLVISEAREAGCAIVASNVDGIPEALDYGKAGLLVPPKNSDVLAVVLEDLLSNSKSLQSWKKAAQSNLEWLAVERVNRETLAVYTELLSNRK